MSSALVGCALVLSKFYAILHSRASSTVASIMKIVALFPLLLLSFFVSAQSSDSLFIHQGADSRWYAQYSIKGERNVFDVAKKFGLPPASLADANHLSYTDRLESGNRLRIPLNLANWYNYTPPAASAVKPIYLRATRRWNMDDLSKQLGVTQRLLEEWNGAIPDAVEKGTVVKVGWISVGGVVVNGNEPDPRASGEQTSSSPSITWPDTAIVIEMPAPAPVLPPMQQAFLDQTAGGTMVTTEKGPVAFFPARGGTIKGVHYAFHNTAARGSVIRVHNPGTGRTVYVKVLGPLPGTKQYAGAILGVSIAAKEELGVRGDARAWCEVSHAGY